MKISLRPYRRVLLASAATVAALGGSMLLPAAASAQSAGSPVTPTITLVLSPATVDYGHQSVTASGAVTTSGGPVTGAAVTVSYLDIDGQPAQISLKTGTSGNYSGTIPDPETAAQSITATVAATASTTTASASAQLGFTTDAVTITGSFAQPTVNAGSTDTLSGVASYVFGGTPHPLANSQLSITFTESGAFRYSFSATVTTAADGSFSYTTPAIYLAVITSEVTVSSAATAYLDAGQVSVTLPVNQVVQFEDLTAAIGTDRVLQFSVCAGIPEPLADSPLFGPVEYQYSKTPHGPWKTLGTANAGGSGPCFEDTYGGTYSGKFTAPLASAYYRAYAPAVPGQMAGASQVIHLWHYPTRITGFSITARRVDADGKVTIFGRLLRLQGKWRSDAHRTIVIEYRYKNKTYILSHRLTTDSAGRFRGTFAVPHTAAWRAVYRGGSNEFATTSKAVTIRVR